MIKSYETAMARSKLSAPVQWAIEKGEVNNSIYDYGCGRGDDVRILNTMGYKAIGYDPHWAITTEPNMLEFTTPTTIFCSYVLNVIADKQERKQVLLNLRSVLRRCPLPSNLYVAVRSSAAINKAAKQGGWTAHLDGYMSSATKNTFQKGYTKKEISETLGSIGLTPFTPKTLSGGYVVRIEKGLMK